MNEDEHDRRITAAQEAERPASRGRAMSEDVSKWLAANQAYAISTAPLRAQLRAMHRRAQRAESEAATWRRRAIRGENDAAYWRNRWVESEDERKAPTVRLVPLDLVAERDAALARVRELEAQREEDLTYIRRLQARIDLYRAREKFVAAQLDACPSPSWRNLWGRW